MNLIFIMLIALSGYSQVYRDSVHYSLDEGRKIAEALLKGDLCKKNEIQLNKIIEKKDSVILLKDKILNRSLITIDTLYKENKRLESSNKKLDKKYQKEFKRKKVWRVVSISSIGGNLLLSLLLFLKIN